MMLLGLFIGAATGYMAMLPVLIGFQFVQRRWMRKNHIQAVTGHTIGVHLFAFLLAGILTVTGIPNLSEMSWDVNMNVAPFVDIQSNTLQYVQNMILFVPYGLLLPMLWSKFASFHKVALSGLLFSVAIETAQLLNYRASDIDDLIMNTLGAVVGYLLYLSVRLVIPGLLAACRLSDSEALTDSVMLKEEAHIYVAIAWLTTFFFQSYIVNGVWEFMSNVHILF